MIPKIFTAGDTLEFTEYVSDYAPEDGWALSYVLVNALNVYTVSSSDNGDSNHLVAETAANTAAWVAGEYRWQSYVTKGAERYTVARGSVTIKPNFADGAIDARSHVEKVLSDLEALLEGKAGVDVVDYTINGRQIAKASPEQLLIWRDKYKIELARLNKEADLQAGIKSSNKVYTRLKV